MFEPFGIRGWQRQPLSLSDHGVVMRSNSMGSLLGGIFLASSVEGDSFSAQL